MTVGVTSTPSTYSIFVLSDSSSKLIDFIIRVCVRVIGRVLATVHFFKVDD